VQIRVTGRHMEISEAVKAYAHDKAAKLQRFYDRIEQIDVIIGEDSGWHQVEMIVRTGHADPFVAQERSEDLFAAVDLVVGKLERQLTRHKERFRNRKHAGRKPPEQAEG